MFVNNYDNNNNVHCVRGNTGTAGDIIFDIKGNIFEKVHNFLFVLHDHGKYFINVFSTLNQTPRSLPINIQNKKEIPKQQTPQR